MPSVYVKSAIFLIRSFANLRTATGPQNAFLFVKRWLKMSLFVNTPHQSSKSFKPSPFDWCDVSLSRIESSYENKSARFICKEKNFNRQYSCIYNTRINSMLEAVKRSCIKKWGDKAPINRLSEVPELGTNKCILIGTLYKNQELKPSVIKELSEENKLLPQPKMSNYVSSTDQLILEDGIQRIVLSGNIDINKFVCGVIIAIYGSQKRNGIFEVEEYAHTQLNLSINRYSNRLGDGSYVLIVSGLDIEGTSDILPVQLMIDWVNGELGCPADQKIQSRVCRVIIAGNSVKRRNRTGKITLITSNEDSATDLETLENIKLLDKLLLNLVRNVPVDILPGECDPSNHTIPQQPIHRCIFPVSSKYKSLNRVTNPYECLVDGRIILGTSGQPIKDIMSLTDYSDPLDALENTLLWGHLAPTAPDTLACYPYSEQDPFVITEQPDIYFCGNVSRFGTKLINMNDLPIRIVCLPMFAETQTCALINLNTLECNPLQFKIFGH